MTFLSTSEIYDNMHPVSATKYSTIHNDTSKHHVLQNTCHATHPYTPAPQNVACPARTHRDDPKSHARKMQPMLQPNQALQSNHCATRTCTPAFGSGAPATTRHRAAIQNGFFFFSSLAERAITAVPVTARYHPKWPPHHTHAHTNL